MTFLPCSVPTFQHRKNFTMRLCFHPLLVTVGVATTLAASIRVVTAVSANSWALGHRHVPPFGVGESVAKVLRGGDDDAGGSDEAVASPSADELYLPELLDVTVATKSSKVSRVD